MLKMNGDFTLVTEPMHTTVYLSTLRRCVNASNIEYDPHQLCKNQYIFSKIIAAGKNISEC